MSDADRHHEIGEDSLTGRVAIITGAGRGIGQAIALGFAGHGAAVVLAARSLAEVEKTAQQIQENGGRALPLSVDVANRSQVQNLVRQTLTAFGRVDILVNNAGVQGPIGSFVDNDWQDWHNTIQINLMGTMFCCQAVLPHFITQGSGKIINLSGGGATAPRPNFSAYGASKAAIVRLTETLAVELAPHNIQVNAIAPGAVNTRMLDEVLIAGDQAGSEIDAARSRSKDGGTPVSLAAGLALFLAGESSGDLSGKLIAAPHDGWQNWNEARIDEIMSASWYTLRRLDPYTINNLTKTEITS